MQKWHKIVKFYQKIKFNGLLDREFFSQKALDLSVFSIKITDSKNNFLLINAFFAEKSLFLKNVKGSVKNKLHY